MSVMNVHRHYLTPDMISRNTFRQRMINANQQLQPFGQQLASRSPEDAYVSGVTPVARTEHTLIEIIDGKETQKDVFVFHVFLRK